MSAVDQTVDWPRVKFGDVVRNVNENSRDLASDGLDRVVGLDHLDPGSLRLMRWDNLADLPDGTTFTRKFEPGQVLFGKRRAYQRKVAVPDFAGVCSGDILVFEPSDKRMLAEFLPYLVQSDGFFDHALGTSAGSLSPRTKWAELAKYEFVLPPLDEQRRVVAALGATDRVVEGWRAAEVQAKQLLDALVAELHLDTANSPQIPLTQIAELQPGRQLSPHYQQGERPVSYLRAANLKLDWIDFGDVKTMDFSATDEARYRVRKDDILLVEGGDPDKVGAPTYVTAEPKHPLCMQNTIIRVRAKGVHYSPRFLYWLLRSKFMVGEFERLATGTKLYHLGLRKVESLELPSVPLEMQEQAAHRLDKAHSYLTSIRGRRTEVMYLRSALIARMVEAAHL